MKRGPNSELNQDNWDAAEQSEERGHFVTADSNIISQRKVISARRKPSSNTAGIFKSFGGFSQSTKAEFCFAPNKSCDMNKEKHLSSIKMLNEKFLECISKHINENPFCILTPTLDDYNKHLNVIKTKYPLSTDNNVSPASEKKSVPINSNAEKSLFPFEGKNLNLPDNKLSSICNSGEKHTISFGKKEDNSNTIKTFSFGTPKENSTNSLPVNTNMFDFLNKKSDKVSGFNLPTSSISLNTSLFGNGGSTLFSTPETVKPEEEEEYIPPKPDVLEFKEKDSTYEIKCKLYYQKNKEWKERGVGKAFIKPISKGKLQLVIRAEDSLATILLNVNVTDKTPMTTKKNNVSLVTITDFDNGNNVTSLLIRVKSSELAEELLTEMKKQL